MEKRQTRCIEHDVLLWKENVPVYRLRGVSLSTLQARPKNAHKLQAQLQIDWMEDWESDGASGIFQDEDGNPLVAYFARRRPLTKPSVSSPTYGHLKMT